MICYIKKINIVWHHHSAPSVNMSTCNISHTNFYHKINIVNYTQEIALDTTSSLNYREHTAYIIGIIHETIVHVNNIMS